MTNQKSLRNAFQQMLKDVYNDTGVLSTLDQLSTALSDVQQALTQEGIAFGFSFGHYETISPTLADRLSTKTEKNLKRSTTQQCAINYHINGQDYSLALARFRDTHYGASGALMGKEESYDVVVSPKWNFRFDSRHPRDPLKALKKHLVQQAAIQQLLQSYKVKSQPRRIQRIARQV